nr:hypothetical protein [Tanacetum cinerariifolium]
MRLLVPNGWSGGKFKSGGGTVGVVVIMTVVVVELVGEEVPWLEEVEEVGLLESQRELQEKWENGGEVNGGRDGFWVIKSSLGEILDVVIGESGGETFRDDEGAVCPTFLTRVNLRKLKADLPNDAYYDVWIPLALIHEMQMQMRMFKRCGTSDAFDVGYRVLRDLILHHSSINNSVRLSNKFGESYFIFKFGILGLLQQGSHSFSRMNSRFSSTEPREDKERALWVELKRLFKPDANDVLWKLQRYMHVPLTWRLYNDCRVHHVSSTRGHDIYMLKEKDYPLSNAIMILMLSGKLQVEEDNEMVRDLVMKIFIKANRPRNKSV